MKRFGGKPSVGGAWESDMGACGVPCAFRDESKSLSSYVKSTFRFPKMVVGSLGNVWDNYGDNLKVKLQCVNGEIIVRLYKAYFHTKLIKNYKLNIIKM